MESHSKDWQEAWRVTEWIISKFYSDVKNNNSEFVLLIVPPALAYRGFEVHPSLNLNYPTNRITLFAENNGIHVVNLHHEFQNLIDQEIISSKDIYYPIAGHWTESGHKLAAQILAEYLSKNHLIPSEQ